MSFRLKSVWVALALASVAAQASNDIYVGAGIGAAHFNGLSNINGGSYDATDDAAAANIFVGYNFTEHFGAELGYQYAGRGNTEGQRYESQGATFSSVVRLPLLDELSLFVEGGAYWVHTDGLGTTDTKVAPLAGVGLTYQVSDELDLQARYRYLWDVADLHADGERYKSNQGIATLEAVYHPFRAIYVEPAPAPAIEDRRPVAAQSIEKQFELNADVLFTFGKANLKQEGIVALNDLYRQIHDFQPIDGSAIVVGYTDRIGSEENNQKLSEARANTVANFLINKGIVANKVTIEGRGEANSVTGKKCDGIKARNEQITCLAPDRRVEVRVSGIQRAEVPPSSLK